jgi:hypothetical protein
MEQLSPNVLLVPKNPEIFNVRTSLRFNTFLLVAIAVLGIWLYQLLSSFPASHFPVNPEISLSIIELCIALVVARGYFRLRALQCIERQRGIFAHIESFRTIPGESSSRAGIFLSLPAITLIPHKGSVWSYLLCLLLLILLLFIPPLIGMLAVAGLFLFLLTMLILIAFFVFLCNYSGPLKRTGQD